MTEAFRNLPDKYKDALLSEGLEDMMLIDRRSYGESVDEEGNKQINYKNPKPDNTYNVNIFTEGFLSPQRIESVRAAEKMRASRIPEYQYLKNQIQSNILFRQATRAHTAMKKALKQQMAPGDLQKVQRMNAGLMQGENVYILGKRNKLAKLGGGIFYANDDVTEPMVGVTNELLVPQEVAHAKAYRAGRKDKHRYDAEFYANSEAMKSFRNAGLSRKGMKHAASISDLSNLSYALPEMYSPALSSYLIGNYDILKRKFPKKYALNTSAKTRQALYDAWKQYQVQ
jgi:hypothetical protein